MDSITLNRSDHIKILIKTIPLGIVASASWMVIIMGFKRIEFENIEIRMVDILFQVMILLLISILPTLVGNILHIRGVIDLNRNRTMSEVLFSGTFHSLAIIMIILFFQSRIIDGLTKIGLVPLSKFLIFDNLATGLIVFILLSIILGLVQKFRLRYSKDYKERVLFIEDLILFQSQISRILALLMLGLMVISEELLYRGFLVIFLGGVTHFPIGLGLTSIVLSILGHLYQGREKIIYHIIFSMMFVSIVLLTRTIFVSITIHMLINYSYAFSVWRRIEKSNMNE